MFSKHPQPDQSLAARGREVLEEAKREVEKMILGE
jgi:hypothetical protein